MEKEYIVTLHKDVDPIAFRQDMIADNMLPLQMKDQARKEILTICLLTKKQLN